MRVLRAADRIDEPWRNGRGHTAVVAAQDGWRVSIAQLRDGAPFSRFAGMSRRLIVLSPAAVTLSVNGLPRRCDPLQVCAFEGEDAVCAVQLPGPVEVLNLMWQRDRHQATLGIVAVDGSRPLRAQPGALLLALAITGSVRGEDGARLGARDGLILTGGEGVEVHGHDQLAVVGVQRATDPDRPGRG